MQSEDIEFVSKEAERTRLRQSYFAKWVGEGWEPGGKPEPEFVYGEVAKGIRDLEAEAEQREENNDKNR